MENKFVEGTVLLIDKPLTWTSFNVVKKIEILLRKKYNLKKIKVGHVKSLEKLSNTNIYCKFLTN